MASAKDVMTKNPIVLESSTLISEAVELFNQKKISSVPVFSTMGEIAGLLTELVLVRALVLHQLQPGKFQKIAHCLELLEPASFVEPEDNITTVMKSIMKSTSRRVLVRSGGRKIDGIISPKDLLRVLISDNPESQSMKKEIEKL